MSHVLTLKKIEPVTPDTHHLVFTRPEGFEFRPGQGVDLALDQEGWRDEKRPFTPVSLPDEPTLEFVIKSYPEHDGVTKRIGRMQAGDRVIIDSPWGAINDKGPGWFIAGGAGVTPFVAILRQRLADTGTLEGCTLIFSNETEKDIILREEFEDMDGLTCVFTVTDQPDAEVETRRIDKEFLSEHVSNEEGVCYVCGPDKMIDDVVAALRALGVPDGRIVTEDFD